MDFEIYMPSNRLSWVTMRDSTYIIDEADNAVITLEEVGVDLWRYITLGVSRSEIVKKISSTYKGLIDAHEIESAIDTLLELKLIEVFDYVR